MTGETDVLIVGGGIAGLATAWWLGRRGDRRVVLVEREGQLGTHSTALNAAMLRTTDADARVSQLAATSAAFLREPPHGFTEVPLVDPCGMILLADGEAGGALASWVERDAEHTPYVRLERDDLATLAPHYDGVWSHAFLFPDQGHIDIAALVEGFARGARAAGVEIRTGAGVREILVSDGTVEGALLDDGTELRAATVVDAAGGWAGELGARAGSRVELTPIRRHLMVTAPDARVQTRWPILWQLSDAFYCKPESGGMMLCGCDEVAVNPDECLRDDDVRAVIAEKVARQVPSLADAGVAHFWCGMRTMCADGRFALGPDPDVPGLFWVAGLGGHGMVCGAEVGRLAAARIAGEGENEPLYGIHDPARLVPQSA